MMNNGNSVPSASGTRPRCRDKGAFSSSPKARVLIAATCVFPLVLYAIFLSSTVVVVPYVHQPPAAGTTLVDWGRATMDAYVGKPHNKTAKENEHNNKGDRKTPSKPLRKECLEIVQKAHPVDLKYEDVANGHKEHPHMGARDAGGKLGYVQDETSLRKNPPPFSFQGEPLQRACAIRDYDYRMIQEKIVVDLRANDEAEKSGHQPRVKLFCLVYTTHAGHAKKIPAIRRTWGKKCDGFIVGSTKTEPALGAVNIVHEGPEEYQNIWQKVRSMWSYVYDNYYDKYDWFHIGGDDLLLIVENLRLYLESEEIRTAANGGVYLPSGNETNQVPLYLGRRFAFKGRMDDIYNAGGAGYTVNKAALKTLVVQGLPNYWPENKTFMEDVMIGRVFRNFGIYPYDTKDEAGGERYMHYMPRYHYGGEKDPRRKTWYDRYSINIKQGVKHSAAKSIAFHYVKPEYNMYRFHALLYHLCPQMQNQSHV